MGKGNIPFSLGAIMDMLMEKGKKLGLPAKSLTTKETLEQRFVKKSGK